MKIFSGKANDVWALGVTLFCLIYNELPFRVDTELQAFERILDLQVEDLELKRQISSNTFYA